MVAVPCAAHRAPARAGPGAVCPRPAAAVRPGAAGDRHRRRHAGRRWPAGPARTSWPSALHARRCPPARPRVPTARPAYAGASAQASPWLTAVATAAARRRPPRSAPRTARRSPSVGVRSACSRCAARSPLQIESTAPIAT
ncbi:hypothetical protein G6F31_018360 [Rhizopus arrhizus]|nr:hypothetical protein G6F31_018360 [Rhizopus arrhizus]